MHLIQFLMNYLLQNEKLVDSLSHYSEISEIITTEIDVLGDKFQVGIHFFRKR